MASSKSKLNYGPVINRVRRLWDDGVSKSEIVKQLNISRTALNTLTKDWKREFKTVKERSFCYHSAYCLLYEHGLTFNEAAQALEVKPQTLRKAMRLNKKYIESTMEEWRFKHTQWRLSLRQIQYENILAAE